MTLDFARLADRIRARAGVLYPQNPQEELIRRTKLGRSTVQRLWAATAKGMPTPATQEALERELGWVNDSISSTLHGGEPTLRREPVPYAVQDADSTPPHPALAGLNEDVEFELAQGRVYGTQVIKWEVEGEEFSLIIVAKRGKYDTPERRAAAKSAYETWLKVREGIQEAVDRATEGVEPQADD